MDHTDIKELSMHECINAWNVPTIHQRVIEDIKSEIKGWKTLWKTSAVVQDAKDAISPFGINELNYSPLQKFLRVTAYVTCFLQKLKKEQRTMYPKAPS